MTDPPPYAESKFCERCGHEYVDPGTSKVYNAKDLCGQCVRDDQMLIKIARDWTVSP